MKKQTNQQGFTLVELSIVLVIIGLIVSGILVGQDMIRAAEIRSTVSQMEQFNTAVNTFRDKYRNLPGDMLSTDAARFGFETRAGTTGQGDGNRLLQAGGTIDGSTEHALGHETGLFWRDLSQAGLLGNSFVTATDTFPAATVTAAEVANWLPEANIGQGHYFTIHAQDGRNHFSVAQVRGAAITTGVYDLGTAMTPQTAFNIDDKMDDGNPFTGIAQATYSPTHLGVVLTSVEQAVAVPAAPAGDANDCAGTDAVIGATYATINDVMGNNPACQLRIRSSF